MEQAEQILAGLGGSGNILELEACSTRLRAALRDVGLVDEDALQAAGAHGVLRTGSVVQVVVGPGADTIAAEMGKLLL